MKSSFFNQYQDSCSELNKMGVDWSDRGAKKLKGALMVELLKKEIENFLVESNEPFKVSAMNTYIAGSCSEYDLLIVKENAKPYMNLVYRPDDVVAVIESKAAGLCTVDSETDNIAKAANAAIALNSEISFGYITLGENIPVNDFDPKTGKPHINHWNDTYTFLKEKVHGRCQPYSITLHQGGWERVVDEGSDEDFRYFINFLIGKADGV